MIHQDILDLVAGTPIADTHEHLLEEHNRLQRGMHWRLHDFAVFFVHYIDSDLRVAGMPEEAMRQLIAEETPPERKWELVKPWYERTHNTGYALNVRESLRALFGIDDFTDQTWPRVQDALTRLMKPGYYRHVLQAVANIDHCQVNSLEYPPFCETRLPDLLLQDISTVCLSTDPDVPRMEHQLDMKVRTLDDWYQVIDRTFAVYGPRAVAVKNQSAYRRKLDYAQVSREEAAPIFERFVASQFQMSREERKPLEDHLFHYCVRKATEYGLPVKLHTGYYAGHNSMPLHRLRHNAGDMCQLCQAHPDARFVFMHITYPYQDEAIAVAKQYTNAYVDMCWAWIINPVASVRFLKEFLLAAPASKVLTFGGDYGVVEMVPGHARIARRGIAQSLSELVDEGWLQQRDIPALVERLLRVNAWELFDIPRCRAQATAALHQAVA